MPIFLSISVLFVLALLIWLLQDLWQGRAHRQRHQAWAVEAAAWNGRAQRWSQFAQALQAGEVGGPLVPPPLPAEPPAPPIPGPGSGAQVPLAVIITALTGLVGAGGKIYLDSQAKALAAKTAVADSLLKQVQEWQSLETELFQYDLASWGRVRDHVAPPPGPGLTIDGGLLDGGCDGKRASDGRVYPPVYAGTEAAVINCDAGKVVLTLRVPAAILLRSGRMNRRR